MAFIVHDKYGDHERIVIGAVVVPNQINVFGDFMSEAAVRELAYSFMANRFAVDVEHDNVDVAETRDVVVVESFVARPGDPDFAQGAWVVATKVLSDAMWDKVLSGEINGYSYEATMHTFPVCLISEATHLITGVTEPDPIDDHTHVYAVTVDAYYRPISGGTGDTDGHSHGISTHTATDVSNGHSHRYEVHKTGENT